MVEASTNIRVSNLLETFNELRFPLTPRTKFQYCNITFGLVGHVIASISGMLYEDFVKVRILEPLGMLDTTWSHPSAGRSAVQGYLTTWKDERLTLEIDLPAEGLPLDSIIAPSGGILSTARDMAKWLAFLLRLSKGAGTADDLGILKAKTIRDILCSRVIANQQIGALPVEPGESLWEELAVPTYALGQLCGTYRGVNFASHNGTHAIVVEVAPSWQLY